jgi:hypothetical protein
MKISVLFILLSYFSLCQDEEQVNRFTSNIETNSFISTQFYQGQNVLLNFNFKINKNQRLGISSGCFYHQQKNNDKEVKRMTYTYFPLFFSIEKIISERKSYLGLRLGVPILFYFDSEYTYHLSMLSNQMWPNDNDIKNLEHLKERSKNFLILNTYYLFKIQNKFSGLAGLSSYFSQGVYLYVNLGLSYQFR